MTSAGRGERGARLPHVSEPSLPPSLPLSLSPILHPPLPLREVVLDTKCLPTMHEEFWSEQIYFALGFYPLRRTVSTHVRIHVKRYVTMLSSARGVQQRRKYKSFWTIVQNGSRLVAYETLRAGQPVLRRYFG